MRKHITTIALVSVLSTFSLGAVELCFANGRCDRISEVKEDGVWRDDCCSDFDATITGHTSCEDDCGD